jgi:hypothetical protein
MMRQPWLGEKLSVNKIWFGKSLGKKLILRSRYRRKIIIIMSEEKVMKTIRPHWFKKSSN